MINTQNQKAVLVTPPAAILDNASAVTNSIDTQGWNYLDIYVMVGATDIAMAALKLQTSDTDGSYADLSGANFATDGTLPSATADNTVVAWHVNLLGKKRFFDVVATAGDGTAGTYLSIIAVLSRGETAPKTAAERGLGQELFV
jgi:hypothetical protein